MQEYLIVLLVIFDIYTLVDCASTPQVVKSFHNIRVGKDSAVSITALSVSCFSILIWILYGFMADDSLIKVSALVALSINSLIIVLELIGKRKRALESA